MIIFLSQMFCCLSPYGIIAWIFKNIPIRSGGGRAQMGKITYAMGGGS